MFVLFVLLLFMPPSWLPGFLLACLSACLSACLFACLPTYLTVSFPASLPDSLTVEMVFSYFFCILFFLLFLGSVGFVYVSLLPPCLPACLAAWLHDCQPVYLTVSLPPCLLLVFACLIVFFLFLLYFVFSFSSGYGFVLASPACLTPCFFLSVCLSIADPSIYCARPKCRSHDPEDFFERTH